MNSFRASLEFSPFADPRPVRAIAIVGVSGRYPGGANSPELLWRKLKAGVDCVTEAKGDRWDLGWHHPDPRRPGRVYTRAGGFLDRIDEFDADFFGLSPREARQVDPQQRLLLELAWEAFEDAAIPPRNQAGSNTGVFIGISGSDYAAIGREEMVDAYTNTGSAFSIAANRISYIFDLKGPSFAVDTACSSSLVCVHQACMSLLAGECAMALAGGVNILMHIRPWVGFSKASMLSPTGRCKSFDASGDGYVRAEGGGLVLLKPLAAAERDGDRILGVILASGINSDGRTMGLSLPDGEAQENLLRKVYANCGVKPEDVFYVEAHGTGTSVGDPIECGALGRVLGAPRTDGSQCLVGSVKSNIGHLEPASGIAGLTKMIMALKHREIPANLHFNTPNPKIEFDDWKLKVVDQAIPLPQRERPIVVGVNSFGFGGTNAHVVLQEYRPSTHTPSIHAPKALLAAAESQALVVSAHSDAALREVARAYVELLHESKAGWDDICAAAATCRSPLRHRLALLASSAEEASAKLESYLRGDAVAGLATGRASGTSAPIAFVYSGNGPQWWGMGRQLLAANPVFAAEVREVDAIFAPLAGWSIIEEMGRPESESRIARTEIAQPMLFAQQLGVTRVLSEAGIRPAVVFGHSVGEVAAACASGALSREQATRVIYHRSCEQAKTAGLGRMAALGVDPEQAQQAMERVGGWLELAAVNSAQAVTVAGDEERLERLVQDMTAAGKFARVLQLDYPFHTKAMEPLRDGLIGSLGDLAPGTTTVPFISTVAGAELEGTQLGADYWYRNVREPVRFHDGVTHALAQHNIGVFLEIGPHPVLKDYAAQSAKSVDAAAVSLHTLRRPGTKGCENDSDNLATAISACHAHGASDLASLYKRPTPPPALPLYPWQRARHWRGGVTMPGAFSPTERQHPLLGYRVPSADGLWENTLDANLTPYLKDHVIQDAVLFPAAGYVEAVLAAGRAVLGAGVLDLENVEILRPLALPDHSDPLMQVSVDPRDGAFFVNSKPDRETPDWTLNVRGRLSRLESVAAAAAANPSQIKRDLPCVIDAAAFYADARARGMDYGPTFQGLKTIWLTNPGATRRAALAEIEVDLEASALADYSSHPTLLDSCLQALVGLVAQGEKRKCSAIPVQIERLRSLAPLPKRIFCHLLMRRESERSAVADFHIMDADGKLVMTLEGARGQKVDFQRKDLTTTGEWWRPDPSAPPTAPLPPLPSPSQLRARAAADVERVSNTPNRAAFYRDIGPRLHRLIGAYASKALAELTAGAESFDIARLARKGRVKRDQTTRLKMLIRFAQEDGRIEQTGAAWRWTRGADQDAPEALWRELFATTPAYQAELLTLSQIGDNLASILRGEDTGDLSTLLEQLQDMSPYRATHNELAQTLLAHLVATWPSDRPLRVLEIGGASGSLTAWTLPILPMRRTDYLFTDPSAAAVGRASHRFMSYAFARFATLDPMLEFADQGQPNGHFDLVIGADALNLIDDTQSLLARVRRALAPDGLFLALQGNRDRFADFVFEGREIDARAELAAAEYEDVVTFDDIAAERQGVTAQWSLLLARAPASSLKISNLTIEAPSSETRRLMLTFEADSQSCAFAERVALAIEARGGLVARLVLDANGDQEALLTKALARENPQEIVYLSDRVQDDAKTLGVELRRCGTAAQFVRALAATSGLEARLTFVTHGAFPTANGQGPLNPSQAPLWGMGRVIVNEHTNLNLRLIDLHSQKDSEADAASLASELLRRDAETEIQLAAGLRYVNRRRFAARTDDASGVGVSAFELAFEPQGGIDSLHLRETSRRAPGAHEVEIAVKAAGLNFRDVLWTMGMLPEEAVENGFSGPTIGMECSGEVVRVGEGVTTIRPGDRVIAFASSCFASHVTTDAGSVARIPDEMSFDEAATIPTAFLTAYYALEHLARLQPGETVLIHGAAGGVGLAAIQIAKLKGVKVIGTSGSARKRRMLEMAGVDHTLNSRSLEFADEVMRFTNGVGVDVVLNSLAGEAITKSLQTLRPFGRFLEIGKRDLYANSRIGLRPFRHNLSYFGIDADTLLTERADLARALMKDVMALFTEKALRPLPFQRAFISRAPEAFRAMQQSRHVGKLVISIDADRPERLAIVRNLKTVRPNATYLVTGGLGGFGLATAEWLVEQGATSLALLGRRGAASDEAREAITRMTTAGATVHAFAVDIADADALEATLATIRTEMVPLAGVIHSAAVIEDAPVVKLNAEQIERVFRPKLVGAWNLHVATQGDKLEIFVLYSSSSVAIGNPGQSAYVAANLYLDSLALHRRALGLPALSVEWGAIKDAGFLTRNTAVAHMLKTRSGLDATSAKDALADLGRLLSDGAASVCVANFDLQKLNKLLASVLAPRFLPIVPKNALASLGDEETLADRIAKTPPSERRDLVLAQLRVHGARVLGTSVDQIDVDQQLGDLGFDSLMAVELAAGLERDLGRQVSVMQLLGAGSLSAIADLVLRMLGREEENETLQPTSERAPLQRELA